MKTHKPKKIVHWTLKNTKFDTEKLSEGSGRCPKNPQGTGPLTPILGAAQTRPRRKQEKGAVAPFPNNRIFRGPYVKGLSRHILAPVRCGIPRSPWQRPRSIYATDCCFCIFRIVCWPRKISNCHLPGIVPAFSSVSTLFKTSKLAYLCGRRKL